MGMHTDVRRVYVRVQKEQAADSWAKAKTYALLRTGDSEEERARLRGTERDREKAGQRKVMEE